MKIKNMYDLVSVILFGSIARGKGKKESDIDLLIILADASKKTILKKGCCFSKSDFLFSAPQKHSLRMVHGTGI